MKKHDVYLVGGLLLLSCLLFFTGLILRGATAPGEVAVILIDGEEYMTLDLATDRDETITFSPGEFNAIRVRDGAVEVTDASCPDQICVRHHSISHTGETIVCLPHKLSITIRGGETALDAVTK